MVIRKGHSTNECRRYENVLGLIHAENTFFYEYLELHFSVSQEEYLPENLHKQRLNLWFNRLVVNDSS